MRLSPGKFNALLNGIGQQFLWRRAYACPCITPHSGASKPNCPLCNGNGRLWSDGVQGGAGIAGAKVQRQFAQLGVWQAGDTALTIGSDSPLYAIGPFDRVLALNTVVPFSDPLTRGMNDKLRFTAIGIDRVFWLSPAGTAVIEGGIPAIAADGTLSWSSGEPPAGTVYSITGTRRMEYFMFTDLPRTRAEHSGAALPKSVLLRAFDLPGRRSA